MNHVGFTSSFKSGERQGITEIVEPFKGGIGFGGRSPGGPGRWNGGEAKEWEPLTPQLVVEVAYDHFTGDRFRHGTQFNRWRPDKKAKECSIDLIETGTGTVLELLQ